MASRFSAIKDVVNLTNRNKRNTSTGSTTSRTSKASKSIDTSATSSLTVFEIKKEITAKQLQNEEICALTVCKNLIYIATKSGRLSIFEERVNQQASRRSSSSSSLKSHIKHKRTAEYKKAKHIKQMAVCLDTNVMILVLNNGHYLCVDARNLVEYQDTKKRNSVLPMNKTKNAERIITSFKRPHYRFAIVSRKNIYIFNWNKNTQHYAFVREISNSEACVSCVFYNNKLCYSTQKKGFVMHNIKTAQETKINAPYDDIPRMYHISDYGGDYKEQKDDGHLLVQARVNLMIFIDKEGKPAQKNTVNWCATPLYVLDCKQYMMGYLENKQIEVISLVDQKPVQLLDIYANHHDVNDERTILGMYRTQSNHVIIYDNSEVLSLLPTPIHQQISECIKHLRIEKGLKLLMNDGVGPTQNELRAFQAEAGFALLCKLHWKRSMEHLEISDVDPRDIIYLFPDIKFAGFEYEIQHLSAPKKCTIHDIINKALRSRRSTHGQVQFQKDTKQEARDEYMHAIYYLGQFLWKRRSEPTSDDLKIVGAEVKLCVDSALLKIYVELTDKEYSKINQDLTRNSPFYIEDLLDFEEQNACVESECEKILISSQQYYNLALFYRSKKKLEKALHCLYSIGATKEWEGDVSDAIDLSVNILAMMSDKQHLWTYAQWVLKTKPLHAMNIFIHTKRGNEDGAFYIDFDKVIQYLNEDIIAEIDGYSDVLHFDYNECYLEFIVSDECDVQTSKYHDDLAYLYMKKIQKLIQMGDAHSAALDATREKLLKFLEKSQLISPAKLLQHAKKFQLYDEIIELNKKLKNHKAVLYTLVVDKNDHDEAIRYCMETVPCSKDRSDRFLELLKLYFGDESNEKQNKKAAENNLNMKQNEDNEMNEAQHARNQTINIELLQQELNADNDEFAFMDAMIDTSANVGGMNFDFDEVDLNNKSNVNIDEFGDIMNEMNDEITELPANAGAFQVATRGRNRVGAISIVEERRLTQQSEEEQQKRMRKIFFAKGVDILYEYAFEIDYLSVLKILPSNKDVMYFSKYIKKIIPFIVHRRRITQIRKNLHRRQYLRQRTNLAKVRSIAIMMDFNSLCFKCNKNIGSSVFILDPKTRNKYHYSCFYRKRAPKNENIITTQHIVNDSDNDNDNQHDDDNDINPFGSNIVDSNEKNLLFSTNKSAKIVDSNDNNPFDTSTLNNNAADNNPFSSSSSSIKQDKNPFSGDNNTNTNPFQSNLDDTNPFS